jgi:hypothetical protein
MASCSDIVVIIRVNGLRVPSTPPKTLPRALDAVGKLALRVVVGHPLRTLRSINTVVPVPL